jgi:hypothetical protein
MESPELPGRWTEVYQHKLPLCEEAKDVPETGLSPQLAHLFEAFRCSPYAAAPERADELKSIVETAGMCMRPDPLAESWKFDAIPSLGKRIFVGTRTLERLWAYCYGYSTIITEMQKAGSASLNEVENKEEYQLAFYAINWAEQADREDIEGPWPVALPDPRMTAELEHVHAANEIFLMSAGRILLHEIAHVVFADAGTSSEDPREEEFRADEWADRWMLDRWTEYGGDENIFVKRCLGIAVAHAPAIILGFNPPRRSLTHPSPVARVARFLDRIPAGVPSEKRRKDFPAAFLWMILLNTLVRNKVIQEEVAVPASYQEAFGRYAAYFDKEE